MDKPQLDELYHNLRALCVTDDIPQKEAVAGIVSHLTRPDGDYTGLLRFLSYYGEKYVLPDVIKFLHSTDPLLKFSRIVELGSGFGWLGRGISNAYSQKPLTLVDKRQWVLTDVVADIETENGAKRVLDQMKEGDFVVMSELLHCLDNPKEALRPFSKWPMLAVEYYPGRIDYIKSYNVQIGKFGCKPVTGIYDVFPGSRIIAGSTDTHGIWLILPL